MEKHYKVNEVIAFLEEMIVSEMATENEEILYQDYKWFGKLNKNNTYKRVLKKMKKLGNEKL